MEVFVGGGGWEWDLEAGVRGGRKDGGENIGIDRYVTRLGVGGRNLYVWTSDMNRIREIQKFLKV